MSFCTPPLYICRRPNSQTLKFHSPVSPDPLNARWLRSLGSPKSPPLKILDPPRRYRVNRVRAGPSAGRCQAHRALVSQGLAASRPRANLRGVHAARYPRVPAGRHDVRLRQHLSRTLDRAVQRPPSDVIQVFPRAESGV